MVSTEDTAWKARTLWLILGSAALRLLLGPWIGFSVDESYAVVMSRRLALSYYDHPPFLFWIPGIAIRLAGREDAWVARLPFLLMFMVTTWLVYRLGARLFSEAAGFWSAALLNLVLFFTLNAASWVLPDGPLLLWSAAAALSLFRATEEDSLGWWAAFGVLCGLGLLSKYHAAFLLAGAFGYLVTTPDKRRFLRTRGPYLALLLAIVVFLPVLAWNAGHGWASFRFQSGRAVPLEGEGEAGTPFLGTVAGQAAWILPWIWIPLLATTVGALRKGSADRPRWLLLCLGIGPVAFFTLVAALGSKGLPHWEAPGYFMLLPLLGAAVAERLEKGSVWTVRWLIGSTALLAVVLALAVTQMSNGWLGHAAPWLLVKGDPTDDLMQWQPVAARLRKWGYPRPGIVVAGAIWSDAAKLAYALGPGTEVTSVGGDPRGFAYVRSQESLVGQDILLVAERRPGMMEPMITYASFFQAIAPLGTVHLRRHGTDEIDVSVYLGRGFLRPLPPKRGR